MAALYIQEVIIWDRVYDDNMSEFDDLLHELVIKHSRVWIIDVLLSIKPEDINEYENEPNYLQFFSVLKYIGNVEQFREKFTTWINDSNFERGMKYEPILNDFIQEIAKYMPYIPECMDVYKQLKSLTPEDYEDNLEAITGPTYKITG